MNPIVGWALAVLAVALGYAQWGWPGVVLAITCIVFWLLLQFSRALRVMRQAAGAPVGSVNSAVMLNARLRHGMRLLEVIPLAGSLGRREAGDTDDDGSDLEVFVWEDAGGAQVRLALRNGRLQGWALQRPDPAPLSGAAPPSPTA